MKLNDEMIMNEYNGLKYLQFKKHLIKLNYVYTLSLGIFIPTNVLKGHAYKILISDFFFLYFLA